MKSVRVRVPATTANLGPAFDAVGMALDLCNEITMTPSDEPAVGVRGEGKESLPDDASNLVYKAAVRAAEYVGRRMPPLRIKCTNRIPLARGMGSSASAIAGGIVAANTLLQLNLDCDTILALATQMEGHPDNISPALLGGVVASVLDSGGKVRHIRMPAPRDLTAVLAVPDYHLSTSDARAALPEMISLGDAVFNVSRTALLMGALQFGRYDLLATAMVDRLHQPYRAALVPGLSSVLRSAVEAGAWGAAMSGAGPSVVAFCPGSNEADAARVAEAMVHAFGEAGVSCSTLVARPTDCGALTTAEHLPTLA